MPTKNKKNKVGRPRSQKKAYPFITLSPANKALFFDALSRCGGVCISHIGLIVVRKVAARKMFHNFSGKTITIKAHKKLHLIQNKRHSFER